jgi:glycosyltransferase involved in cell wall biosynthesis
LSANGRGSLVSVIIPAFNAAGFIAETLHSVFAQSYRHFETIVVNDGSPDTAALEAALQPFAERVVYLKQENRGVSAARNAGIRAAQGLYLAFLDSDDLWEPGFLEAQVGLLERDPALDLVYSDGLIFGDTRDNGRTFMELFPSRGEVNFESLVLRECAPLTSTVVVRRDAVLQVGAFDESIRTSEDHDLWLRLAAAGRRLRYQRQVLARYRRRKGSMTADPVWLAQNNLQVLVKNLGRCAPDSRESQVVQQAIEKKTADIEHLQGQRALLAGDARSALAHLRAANQYLRSPKLRLAVLGLQTAPRLVVGAYQLRKRLFFKKDF